MPTACSLMTTDVLSKLITLGVALLGAYVTLASFAPKVIEEYRKIYAVAEKQTSKKAKFKEDFKKDIGYLLHVSMYFPMMCGVCGVTTTILVINLGFSNISSNQFTCPLTWVFQYLAALLIPLSFGYLVLLAFFLLNLFVKTTRDLLTL